MDTYKSVNDFFNAETPKDLDSFVDMSLAISDQIMYYLKEKNWSQKDLATALGKKESEISKWLTGTHNFTLKSIAKIAAELDREIITTPLEAKDRYKEIHYVTLAYTADNNTAKLNYGYEKPQGIQKSRKKEIENSAA